VTATPQENGPEAEAMTVRTDYDRIGAAHARTRRAAPRSGARDERFGDLRALDELDLGCRLVVWEAV
jgi:hypothetical protein